MIAKTLKVASNGVFSFHDRSERELGQGTSDRPWYHYLDIDGEPAYLIGNLCGTCAAVFERCSSSLPLTPRQLSSYLENGVETVSLETMETVSALLPQGNYIVGIIDVLPSLGNQGMLPWKMGISCQSDYFWWRRIVEAPDSPDSELILPMATGAFPPGWAS